MTKFDSKLIGTFHLPAESEYVQKAISAQHYQNLKKLDAAIVVSNSMKSDLEKWVGEDKVYAIPHGINTDVFHPADFPQKKSGSLNVLSVGDHGRDWETIQEVLKSLKNKTKNLNCTVVVPEKKREQFKSMKNVKILSNIPETTLIELYQQADVLLLPVLFGTANNTILESLACGTPVISTNVGGISEYVDKDSGWLFEEGDIAGIAALVGEMLVHSSLYLSKREGARRKALSFDWGRISEMVQQVYTDTLERDEN